MRTSSSIAGTLIDGKYRVERALGEGGMGVVMEATHVTLGTRVAVKLLRAEVADGEVRERFAREGQIAAQLAGEHIARVTDTGETREGEPYLVMEFLVGRDLASELAARGRLPIAEAVDLVLQACEGVAEAHAVNLVHRDIKPANLFLVRRRDGSPLVKVLDFGLSKVLHQKSRHLTATTSSFGTPQYMSPEQIASSKYVDTRTDQHALAMVLYELITGAPAFQAETVPALFVVIATQTPDPMRARRPEIDKGLDAAVLKALAKAPAQRFPSLTELAAAIAPFGSAEAGASAKRIAATLSRSPGGGAAPHLPAGMSSPSSVNDDLAITLKKSGGSPGAAQAISPPARLDTQSALTTERFPARRSRAKLILAFAGLGAFIGLAVILVAVLSGALDSAATAASASAPSASMASPDPRPSSGPDVPPGVTVAPGALASAEASAAPSLAPSLAPSASVAAPTRTSTAHPPAVKAGASPASSADGALKVFGTKRK